ncbi:PREDICTED: uncharacterized protein LOC108772972 [Cyphomyrmex costatus]|uniref:uncharacterized protein LOC108772972 n=1 Tax=Cyphomyrmex costatus TaxID=456900 RepID=UPI0008523F1E|nr:PREDICTED: uncharacterized protein LOC108772972 [Cyphomyrmex costatus]
MEPSVEHYYDISKRYLTLIGQWPYQKLKESLLFLSFILICDVTILITQMARFFVCENMQCIFETLPSHLLAAIIPVKIFTYRFNSQKIKDLTDRLSVDWNILETKTERDIMKRYAENGRWYVLIYSSEFAKLLEDTFSISFAVQILLVTICLSITLVQLSSQLHDSAEAMRYLVFMTAQLFHLFCFSFQGQKLINHSLETCSNIYHSSWYKIPVREQRLLLFVMRKSIEACALTAGKIYVFSLENFTTIVQSSMSFAERLEDIFCIGFAVQMLITVITMSVTLLQIVLNFGEITEILKYLMYAFGEVFHTFCCSVQSQRLINHGVQLRDKIYNSFWYEIPVESQRLLLHVMRRSMEPCSVSAGKIYVFSLKSFTTVTIIYEPYVVTCLIL